MLRFGKITRTSLGRRARTLLAQVVGFGAEGGDDDAQRVDDVEALQPMGLFTRPVITRSLEALIMELGEELITAFFTDKDKSAFSDVDEGETRLYAAKDAACRVRLRADGSVSIETPSSVGARVRLLSDGSVEVQGKNNNRVFMNASGGITVDAQSGQSVAVNGASVILNGGTLDVARKTDTVSPNAAMTTWLVAVGTATGAGAPPATLGTITTGNATVKA